MSAGYSVKPALVITEEELGELLKPYVFEIAGDQYALKPVNAFSADDYGDVLDLAEEDVAKVVSLIAYDESSAEYLRGVGVGLLKRVISGWLASEGVTPGESDSSEG